MTTGTEVVSAPRVTAAPVLRDARDASWGACTEFSGFRMRGGAITQRTAVRLGCDDRYLYVACIMHEKRLDALRTDTTARTRAIGIRPWINEDDSIQILIDPLRDGRHYRHFLVNPIGKWMTSEGVATPDRLECDYDWAPAHWTFQAAVLGDAWTVTMRIAASDLGLPGFEDGRVLGFNLIRERAPDPHETSFLAPDSMSWTTHWTSHVSYEPAEFGALALGRAEARVTPFPIPQWQGPPRPQPVSGALLVPAREAVPIWPQPHLAQRDIWFIHPPLEAFPGMETSRLAPFAPQFGWRLRREMTEDLDIPVPAGEEWRWWFHEAALPDGAVNPWSVGVTPEKLDRTVFTMEGRRYANGQTLPPFRRDIPVARKGFAQLLERFGDRFIGYQNDEWDSDIWSAATGMREDPIWDEYPDEAPTATGDRAQEEQILHREWDLFKRLMYDYVIPLNSWRCVDHYALEWGGRCATIELSENGNPSMLTQMAFARGAARQYDTFFAAYQATMMGTGYTNYEGTSQYDANVETVWATGPQFGPSLHLYRRLLFTSYLSGATAMMFEAPQWVHVMPAPAHPGRYELTPHGAVFAELLEYADKYPDRGVPVQPVALLLDYLHGFSPPYQTNCAVGRSGLQTWFSVPYERGDHQVCQTIWTIFPWCRQRIERNGYPLTNTPFGALFDVLAANPPSGPVPLAALERYPVAVLVGPMRDRAGLPERLLEYLRKGGTLVVNALNCDAVPVDLSSGATLFECEGVRVTRIAVGAGQIIAAPDSDLLDADGRALPVLGRLLATLTRDLLPIRVEGDVQYHVLRTRRGWLVALLNNKGVVHHSRKAPDVRADEVAAVRLTWRGNLRSSRERLSGDEIAWTPIADGWTAAVTVAPGGIQIVELVTE